MQFKRNSSTNIQPPTGKTTSLIQPLLNIAKASTPVRTRIMKAGSQMNSTPVNPHKLPQPSKSPTPSNKQNDANNSQSEIKKHKVKQHQINLSPILALNRKLTEGPKPDIRSYTPTAFRRQQSMMEFQNSEIEDYGNQYQLQGMRTSTNFATNLQQRTSNSFKNLIDSRSKTPNRLNSPSRFGELNSNSKKNMTDSNWMRSSSSSQSLLQGVKKLRESKCSKLNESRSSEHMLVAPPKGEDLEVLCMNNHEKKVRAKYKVSKTSQDDQQLLVYCSKCAIGLVKQGFRVEDLTPEDKVNYNRQKKEAQQDESSQYYAQCFQYADNIRKKLRGKCQDLKVQKQKYMHLYDGELQEIDSYYNAIITAIEEQRIKDREMFIEKRTQGKNAIEKVEGKMNEAINIVDHMTKNGITESDLNQLQRIEMLVMESTGLEKGKKIKIYDNIQDKFQYFVHQLETSLKLAVSESHLSGKASRTLAPYPLTPQPQSTQMYASDNNRVPADCPLRFSFETLLKLKQMNKMNKYQGQMKTLEQAAEEVEAEAEQSNNQEQIGEYGEKRAFRALFPDSEVEESQNAGLYSPTFKQF